jgi:hypothetical protein
MDFTLLDGHLCFKATSMDKWWLAENQLLSPAPVENRSGDIALVLVPACAANIYAYISANT